MFGGFVGIVPPGGGTPPLRVSFMPTTAGVRTGQLIITDDAAGSPHIVQFTGTGIAVNAGDFTLTPNKGMSSRTVTSGQTATYDLLAVSGSGFTDNVSLSCTGVPQASSCTVNPTSFQLGLTTLIGTSPQPVTVSVTTTAYQASSVAKITAIPWYTLAAVPAMLLSFRTRRELRRWLLLVVVSTLSLLAFSCGGGSTPPPPKGTPPGTYTLTVTGAATSTKSAHSAQLTLIVN